MVQPELSAKKSLSYPNVKLVYFDVGGVLFRFKGGLRDVDHFQPIPETHQLVQDLSQRRGVGLFTNIYPGAYKLALENEKIPDIPYASVIQSCEVGKIKPDPVIYELAQKKGNVRPEEILFIDDSPRFVTPASEIGWHTFLFDEEKISENVGKLRQALGL